MSDDDLGLVFERLAWTFELRFVSRRFRDAYDLRRPLKTMKHAYTPEDPPPAVGTVPRWYGNCLRNVVPPSGLNVYCAHFNDSTHFTEQMEFSRVRMVVVDSYTTEVNLAPLRYVMETVLLKKCHQVTDISMLAHIRCVMIDECDGITNFDAIVNVRNVFLIRLEQLRVLPRFSAQTSLTLSSCHNVTDLSPLRSCCTVELIGCSGVTDVSPLRSCRRVTLMTNCSIIDVSSLASVRILNLVMCLGITDISAVAKVPVLRVSDCFNLKMTVETRQILREARRRRRYHKKRNFKDIV